MSYLERELSKVMKDKKQREAYFCEESCVVQAGPGSGKTATLTLKIMRLLNENIVPPRGLACVTFNNEAVREFKNRLRLLGMPRRPNIFLGTVHSFCLSCVIRPFAGSFRPDLSFPIRVASDGIQRSCLQKAMDKIGIRRPPSEFRVPFDKYRRTHLDRTAESWNADEEYARAIEIYETNLREGGYLDFDDLVLIALAMIEKEPYIVRCISSRYPWIVIDEYQDLGYPLHRIVLNLLKSGAIKIFAVGDPDQSIYGFTGANPRYLQELSARKEIVTIHLGLNYRSGKNIIDGAGVILAPEIPRDYRASRGDTDPGEIYFYERPDGLEDQSVFICEKILPRLLDSGYEAKEIAVLYIDKNDAGVLIKSLEEASIPYAGERDQRYRRSPVTRWIEDMTQWCCGMRGGKGVPFSTICNFWFGLLKGGGQRVAEDNELSMARNYFRIVSDLENVEVPFNEWLSRFEEGLSLKKLLSLNEKSPDEIEALDSMLSACSKGGPLAGCTVADIAGCGANADRVSLTTLHSSKGLQFDVVIIPGLEEGRLPSYSATTDEAIREARRTFYVGFTRARHLVYLLYSGWYRFRRYVFENGPSRFVLELQKALGFTEE